MAKLTLMMIPIVAEFHKEKISVFDPMNESDALGEESEEKTRAAGARIANHAITVAEGIYSFLQEEECFGENLIDKDDLIALLKTRKIV